MRIHIIIAILLLMSVGEVQPGWAGTLVEFQLISGGQVLGVADVQLYDQDKPVTVNNFLTLIRLGAYNGSFFHRTAPGFVLQGGGYVIYNPSSTLPMTNTISPPPAGNIGLVGNFGPIVGEALTNTFYSNTNGTIAMALSTGPNSGTSQFFFNLTNNNGTVASTPNLDNSSDGGPFTVFGHVIRGMSLLETVANNFSVAQAAGADPGAFSEMPVFYTVPLFTVGPPYVDLIYYNVYVLPSVNISSPTNGWRSTNALLQLTGTAGADSGVAGVWYQNNNGPGILVNTTNHYTNWTAAVPLVAGTNVLNVIAEDPNGHFSPISSISVFSTNTFQLLFSTTNGAQTAGAGFALHYSSGLSGRIEYSTNLVDWLTLTNFSGATSNLAMVDPAALTNRQRFYRAVIP